MKKLPIEERKVSTTFALSLKALEKLDEIQERHFSGRSRSYAMEEIISTLYDMWFPEDEAKLNSLYREVHHAEQTDQV